MVGRYFFFFFFIYIYIYNRLNIYWGKFYNKLNSLAGILSGPLESCLVDLETGEELEGTTS